MKRIFTVFFIVGASVSTEAAELDCRVVEDMSFEYVDYRKGQLMGLYSGEACDGVPHGIGTFRSNGGTEFRGNFHDGRIEGKATILESNGATVSGVFSKGFRHGRFEYVRPSGNKFYYFYKSGALASGPIPSPYIDNYSGELDDIGQKSGYGELVVSSPYSFEYRGFWEHNQMSGKGELRFPSGEYYSGGFLEGSYHGSGELYLPNKYKYIGSWQNGHKNGLGKIIWLHDMSYFEGDFMADLPHGSGKCGTVGEVAIANCRYIRGKRTQ
ncbi:hypothetical protein EZV61_19270 [Corallincola luteus]|uniref:MORN repeat protein n=1 Tax=Corallincola luteus TaxID=1775177 RepID=A0ABY2AGB0_9GAMM|nr:hypothetical protein [Corallincola luteus]TCI01091.1 hypothetical protein EZV61_19270 [Corallincola luteus]